MTIYRFYHPVEVRYADVDAQRHVNNAVYFSYMEQARAQYLRSLGLWSDEDFDRLGVILAEAACRFMRAIEFGQALRVGAATVRLGNKSFEMAHSIQDPQDRTEFAVGRVILVAYDYRARSSIPLPDRWREILAEFEQLPLEGSLEER